MVVIGTITGAVVTGGPVVAAFKQFNRNDLKQWFFCILLTWVSLQILTTLFMQFVLIVTLLQLQKFIVSLKVSE